MFSFCYCFMTFITIMTTISKGMMTCFFFKWDSGGLYARFSNHPADAFSQHESPTSS